MQPVLSGKEARAAAKAARAAKKSAKGGAGDDSPTVDSEGGTPVSTPKAGYGGTASGGAEGAAARVATGSLTSEKRARDVKISAFSLSAFGIPLVEDTDLELTYGHRYGLLGRNGCGKSTLLQCIGNREVPIPDHIDIYLLDREAPPTDLSAVEYVVEAAKAELAKLEAAAEELMTTEGPESEALQAVYDRQEELDPATFESRASSILTGLGFTPKTVHKKTCDMSGGWRMRVALARALFVAPSMLLLDEPTNHLDLNACVWLENYLSTYKKILIVVSHSQDFLDGVCTKIMVMQRRKLRVWSGNYSMYVQTREEQDRNQMTLYKKQQEEIAHIKQFIASCGTYANLVRQAQSRQKQLDKMIEAGLIEMPWTDPEFRFKFPETGALAPPLISFSNVAFSYSGKKEDYLFSGLRFGIDADSRIALVGANGKGKSTLAKLAVGDLQPCEGTVSVRSGLSIGRYHQHSADIFDLDATPVEYISRKFHDKYPEKKLEDWRSVVGTYGIPSDYHLLPIRCLSDGLKLRLNFCEIAMNKPHLLVLDECTNHSDMEMIDSMAAAIRSFEGGVLLISHDFRLLAQVAKEIWIVDGGVKIWEGDIRSYKMSLQKEMEAQGK